VRTRAQGHVGHGQRKAGGRTIRNTILQRIPPAEFEALRPHLRLVAIPLGANLQREHTTIEFAYFLNSGMASLLVQTEDGRSVEVGIAGREEMVGLPLIADLPSHSHSVVMQVPGEGFMIEGHTLKRLLRSLPGLRSVLIKRLGIRSLQLGQNAACNRLHSVRQRVARWLLAAHDRLDSDVVRTTHDFLAKLVGTDRPSVSVAVGQLEDNGIRRSRASIHIIRRDRLEEQACECYAALQRFNAELGLPKASR
jgi:CRP-like cAMP-binding protein